MAFWGVRAGSYGEREPFAIEEGVVVVGWDELPDLNGYKDRASLKSLVAITYPEATDALISNWAGQLLAFSTQIKIGDVVALPRKGTGTIAFGEIAGEYEFHPAGPSGEHHRRPVRWKDTDFPRQSVDEDIRFSLGSTLTVFQVRRNDAEARIRALIFGGSQAPISEKIQEEIDLESTVPIEAQARDRIISHIQKHFKEHDLEKLVEEILKAQGFVTNRTPQGADGGVDILAARGELGFGSPKLAVQVKSSQHPVDVGQVRELQGAMRAFGAEVGLFVSWSGFRGVAPREARRDFFQLRLWSADDIIDQVLQLYDKLSPEIRAQIPLERVWTLVEKN